MDLWYPQPQICGSTTDLARQPRVGIVLKNNYFLDLGILNSFKSLEITSRVITPYTNEPMQTIIEFNGMCNIHNVTVVAKKGQDCIVNSLNIWVFSIFAK